MNFSLVCVSLRCLNYILVQKSLLHVFGYTLRSLVFLFGWLGDFPKGSLVWERVHLNYLFVRLLLSGRKLLVLGKVLWVYLGRLDVVVVDVFIVYRHDDSWLLPVILLNLWLLLLILHRLSLLLILMQILLLLVLLFLLLLLQLPLLLAVLRVKLRDILISKHLRHIFRISFLSYSMSLICSIFI